MTNPFEVAAAAQAERLSPRIDLWSAAVLLAFAFAILRTAVGMPTYADQKGEIYVAPGLVPGIYAVALALLGATLGIRAILRARRGLGATVVPPEGAVWPLAIVAVLGIVFCAGLIGRLPFWLATAIFVTAFIAIFEWPAAPPEKRWRRLATAALQGVITGVAVTLVFQRFFLVRLP